MFALSNIEMVDADTDFASASQNAGDSLNPPTCDRISALDVPQTSQASQNSQLNINSDLISTPNLYSFDPGLDSNPQSGLDDYRDMEQSLDRIQGDDNPFGKLRVDIYAYHEPGNRDSYRAMAFELLLSKHTPLLYRAYAHMILARDPVDRLYHAQQAVEDAQQGVQNSDRYFDDEAALGVLALAEETLQNVLDSDSDDDRESADDENVDRA